MKPSTFMGIKATMEPTDKVEVVMSSGDRFIGELDSTLTPLTETVTLIDGPSAWRISVSHVVAVRRVPTVTP